MFERLITLIGEDDVNKLKKANVLIVGLGGVGGYALETLVRSGIYNLTIVDGDIVELSNLNRQIISKMDVMWDNENRRGSNINEFFEVIDW